MLFSVLKINNYVNINISKIKKLNIINYQSLKDEINLPQDKREAIRKMPEEQKLLMIKSQKKTSTVGLIL